MDYTIGSVADLISGKNTPNKPKVVAKQIIAPISNKSDTKFKVKTAPKRKRDENPTNNEPFKRNEQDPKSKSFKKKPKIDKTTENQSNFTVIDHMEIEKMENVLKGMECDSEEENNAKAENKKVEPKATQKERDSRTLFVGNVAIAVKKSHLIKTFGKYGKIESVRLRCATPANPGVSKRVAVIRNKLHPKRTTLHSYITFEKREDALKGLQLNGTKYKGHYIRVQICDDTTKPDPSKAIFVGNLPFDVEDDDMWKAFESFGPIHSVRIVRNSSTGMGIGVGYVNFNTSDCVELVLQMDDITVKNQKVRIQRSQNKKKSQKQKSKNKIEKQDQDNEKFKKFKQDSNGLENKKPSQKKEKNKFDKPNSIAVKKGVFQGSKSNKKKQKPKINKGVIQKLKLSQKIAPR